MKHQYLLILLLPFLFQSCLKEEQDLFPKSASERRQEALSKNQEILTNATNGWLVEYYPQEEQIYGGYTLFMKFNKQDQVTVASELGNANQTETSLYQIIAENGSILTFNTHNSLLHYFSDPSNPSGIGQPGIGMGGDYEFLILEASPEKVTMRGKKSKSTITMTPINKDDDWEELMAKYKAAIVRYAYKNYKYEIDGKLVANVSNNRHNLFFTSIEGGAEAQPLRVPYLVTPEGFKFYTTITLGGKNVNEMNFKREDGKLFFQDINNSGVKLNIEITPLNQMLVDSKKWYIPLENQSAFMKEHWDRGFELSKTSEYNDYEETLSSSYLGSKDGVFGFNFTTINNRNRTKQQLIGFDYVYIGDNKISLTYNRRKGNDYGFYYEDWGFSEFVFPFTSGSTNTRTFTLTTDDLLEPNWIEMQDIDIPENRIRVYKDEIIYPLAN